MTAYKEWSSPVHLSTGVILSYPMYTGQGASVINKIKASTPAYKWHDLNASKYIWIYGQLMVLPTVPAILAPRLEVVSHATCH